MKSIIMSAPSVRSTIADLKTQTRQKVRNVDYYACMTGDCPHDKQAECDAFLNSPEILATARYHVGEIVYVKEPWAAAADVVSPLDPYAMRHGVVYQAAHQYGDVQVRRWRSPLFMPEWASRLKIEITSVRCERLHEISEEDAIAEGIAERVLYVEQTDSELHLFGLPGWPEDLWSTCPIEAYAQYWESIHGPGAWEENPFVWVYGYRRIA
jgi:hypothetical protein